METQRYYYLGLTLSNVLRVRPFLVLLDCIWLTFLCKSGQAMSNDHIIKHFHIFFRTTGLPWCGDIALRPQAAGGYPSCSAAQGKNTHRDRRRSARCVLNARTFPAPVAFHSRIYKKQAPAHRRLVLFTLAVFQSFECVPRYIRKNSL